MSTNEFTSQHMRALYALMENYETPEHLQDMRTEDMRMAKEGLAILKKRYPYQECDWPCCDCVLDLDNCKANPKVEAQP